MARFRLTLTAPTEYGVEKFDNDPDVWDETDELRTESIRYTSDTIRGSVMSVKGITWTLDNGYTLGDGLYLDDSPLSCGEGVYKDFDVTPNVKYAFSCLYRAELGSMELAFYDQTNETLLDTFILAGSSWKSQEINIIVPKGCNTLRIKFLQGDSAHSGPFYIDNVSLNGNVILTDPDLYRRIPRRIGSLHQTLSGRRIYDLRAIHYDLCLLWNYVDASQYENLREIFYSNELLYFDDGNVPPLVESETIYDNEIYNFAGTSNPSSVHKAYSCNSNNLPSAKNDFEATEYSTSDYQAVSADDDNYKGMSNPIDGHYLYNKLLIKSNIPQSDVKRLRIRVDASSDDSSPSNLDGFVLYGWDNSNWVELSRCSNSSKNSLTYSSAEPLIAGQFIDPSDGYIRLLLRSMNYSNGLNPLNLKLYYVEAEINEDLDGIVRLSHKAILDENGDVISVKNLTKGIMLSLDTDYTVSINRRCIMVTGQDPGDIIEVTYGRYFEVMFSGIPEEWLSGDPENDRIRKVEITLHTLSQSR